MLGDLHSGLQTGGETVGIAVEDLAAAALFYHQSSQT